jgi:hypothetical protein
VVDSGPAAASGVLNKPFVSVTICAPANPSNCQTIDHVLVDTGSYGLRIISSAISPSLALSQQTNASGDAIVECMMFADGYSWGPVKTVNMQIAGEAANGLVIQVIGDQAYSNLVPTSCSSTGAAENTVTSFGANGILGVGPFIQDCGSACVTNANDGYYACSSASCQPTTIGLSQQVSNPVKFFTADNNGVIISLPAIPASGAAGVSGTLTFGVGTQSNNGLGSAQVYAVNANTGYFTTVFNGVSYLDSLLDSGSNGLFFNDRSIPQCSDGSGFYCPSSTLNLTATNVGQNGTTGTVSFEVGNEMALFNANPSFTAFSTVAGTNGYPSSFDWGLPFFFGRSVYTVIEGMSAPGGVGPYFAY